MTAFEPPVELASEIRLLQQAFADKYGYSAALKPPVHITLTPPVRLSMEALKTYRQALEKVALLTKPFEVVLNGFDFFYKARVMYIQVKYQQQLEKIFNQFTHALESYTAQIYRPHITIGYRNIDEVTFKKIVEDYADRPYSGGFLIDNVRLWKHENGCWTTIAQMDFLH